MRRVRGKKNRWPPVLMTQNKWWFPKMEVPPNVWFIREIPLKWMIWRYPYFRKPLNIEKSLELVGRKHVNKPWACFHGFCVCNGYMTCFLDLLEVIWRFPKMAGPPNRPCSRIVHYKPSILGYPPWLWKLPYPAPFDGGRSCCAPFICHFTRLEEWFQCIMPKRFDVAWNVKNHHPALE